MFQFLTANAERGVEKRLTLVGLIERSFALRAFHKFYLGDEKENSEYLN